MVFFFRVCFFFFFFNDTATTEIYTLSLHDALPIGEGRGREAADQQHAQKDRRAMSGPRSLADRKSTRLNSSHMSISYAVFCLKKKTKSNFILPSSIEKNIHIV